ncbi:MAG: hypothetical protein AB7O24_12750 [Kofleriaceae bacterium]
MKARLVAAGVVLACCGPRSHQPPPNLPSAAEVIARLAKERDARTSFTAESVMDFWGGKERVKATVLVMGSTGSKVRFNALSPAGGSVLADMACDGTNFVYIDHQNNCQLSGPCNRASIASLLHVELEPEDFLHLAVGTPPVIEQATGKVTWNADNGYLHVELEGPSGAQTLDINTSNDRWDVMASELKLRDGKVVWSVVNKDWEDVSDATGGNKRWPSKTRFKAPNDDSDLLVEWKERQLNIPLDDAKFQITAPAGLPMCGQQISPTPPRVAPPPAPKS